MKLVSLNIEGRKHLASVAQLLAREDSDIVCLMEVCQSDVLKIAGQRYPYVIFAQNDVLGNIDKTDSLEKAGVAILSKEIAIDVEQEYFGEKPRNQVVEQGVGSHAPVMLSASIGGLRVAAIHFTWTQKGEANQEQSGHLAKLFEIVGDKEMILCGDFNIPRGNENYTKLTTHYLDNIPADVESTIDPVLHYANRESPGRLKLVVNYVWSTPKYKVGEVRVESSVSDHCCVICKIDLF